MCGQEPFVERNILPRVNYNLATGAHIKDDEGLLIAANPGAVGKNIGLGEYG